MGRVKQRYGYRADVELLGEPYIYPGHPITIAYIIAHNFETWEDATQYTENGYSEALSSLAIPGAGERVSSTIDLMEYLKIGEIDLDRFFELAAEIDAHEPAFNGRGSPEQAEKIKPWIQENLINWLRQVEIKKSLT